MESCSDLAANSGTALPNSLRLDLFPYSLLKGGASLVLVCELRSRSHSGTVFCPFLLHRLPWEWPEPLRHVSDLTVIREPFIPSREEPSSVLTCEVR